MTADKKAAEDELLRLIPDEAWNLLLDGRLFRAVHAIQWHSVTGPMSLAAATALTSRAVVALGIGWQ